jgi:azurin
MKIRILFASLVALLLAGCGQKESVAASSPAAAPKAEKAAPAAPAPSAGPRVVEITGNDQMKFSLATIEAKAGEEIKLVLTNAGTLPKEAMGHNWVLLQANVDAMAFAMAAASARDTDYIPAGMKDKVIAHTAILGPRKSDEVTFKAPAAGEYVYLCSFPGHFAVGMKGKLIVK